MNLWKWLLGKPSNKCEHQWGKWQLVTAKSNDYGNAIVFQARICNKCEFREINKQKF